MLVLSLCNYYFLFFLFGRQYKSSFVKKKKTLLRLKVSFALTGGCERHLVCTR